MGESIVTKLSGYPAFEGHLISDFHVESVSLDYLTNITYYPGML